MPEDQIEIHLLRLLILLPVFVPAIAVHEFGHAWMADRCGDDTPRRDGRVTLDPTKHFELVGSIMMIISSITGIGFGWGKPVMVNPRNFHVPRRDDILVTAAGPAMNVLQTGIWFVVLVVLRLIFGGDVARQAVDDFNAIPAGVVPTLFWIAMYGILINLMLIAFNLFPVPPLDGSRIVAQLSPTPVRIFFYQMEQIGGMLLIVLVFTGALDWWREPAARWGWWLIDRVMLY